MKTKKKLRPIEDSLLKLRRSRKTPGSLQYLDFLHQNLLTSSRVLERGKSSPGQGHIIHAGIHKLGDS